MFFSKYLVAALLFGTLLPTRGSEEVLTGSMLLVTMSPNDTGHMITEVIQDQEKSGHCRSALPTVKVDARTSSCGGPNSRHLVKVTISIPSPSTLELPTTTPLAKLYTALTSTDPTCSPPSPCPTSTLPPTTPPTSSSTTPSTPALLPGYERHPGLGCYKFHVTLASWPDAKRTCEDEGSHLVIINSETESTAIQTLMKQHEGQLTDWGRLLSWVGLVESNTTQHDFYTIFGERLSATGFSHWFPEEPNGNSTSGDNVFLYSKDGSLSDWEGENKLPFTCEQKRC